MPEAFPAPRKACLNLTGPHVPHGGVSLGRIQGGVMRHDPASGAVVIMLNSLKLYGMA